MMLGTSGQNIDPDSLQLVGMAAYDGGALPFHLIFGDMLQCGHDLLAKAIGVEASQWHPYPS